MVHMTALVALHRGRETLRKLAADPQIRWGARVAGYALAGFCMSAAALKHQPMPLAMALVSTMTGWRALVMALGAMAGYGFFWGAAGLQGMVWSALAGLTALFLGKGKTVEKAPLLIPALCGFFVSGSGLAFQLLGDNAAVSVYLLRVALGAAGSRLFALVRRRVSPVLDWVAEGAAVLALAQIAPFGFLNFGCVAASALAMAEAFPAAALAGLALDLARITPLPMTAVTCAVYLIRMLPGLPIWARRALPGVVCALVMGLCAGWDGGIVLSFAIGGFVSALLPARTDLNRRRGETGVAQVRLELMANVLSETQQLLMEAPEIPIDEEALLARTRERACGSCPNRKSCAVSGNLSPSLLRKPLVDSSSLPFSCKKPGRMILELRRSQEQFRRAKADRDRRREYRQAVIQQYRFLSEYLRDQADLLPRRAEQITANFEVESALATAGKETANGDKCLRFHGPQCRYYVLLCDGMGTGLGAAQEGQTGANLLRRMLCAGFPAEHALESLNSLLALRGRAGAVTVDLAEIRLDSGRVTLYKWGAAPSYLLTAAGAEKIGTAGPPPGIGIGPVHQRVERLSLRRGETLILLSDGLEVGEHLQTMVEEVASPPGDLAAELLELGAGDRGDDATAVVVRLRPAGLST